ncbi:DUF4332 domain-containing protein [Marispirochaeta sp.]|uniref:DUF4332 domain-containing protein n=1 Tax=Marispirochaeta sp. TaxID=2038653 RepID=UPI0029C752F3|nr:DUF4332 domain-containing protein [Marispirochaeta sp.]
MGYYVDLKSISIDKYKDILKSTELIPSWKVLEENIDDNLDVIKSHNLKNLDELFTALKSKDNIKMLSEESGLPEKYLEVLKRVINGYRQKPNKIKDFSCVAEDTIVKLEKLGIKNTLKLYEVILTADKRETLSKNTGIDENEILKLTKLTDLSRIRWVNHTFAYVLLATGYDTVEKVARADYKRLYTTVKQLNEERKIYNAHIGERDMKMVIESAQELDIEIEY